MQRRNSSVLVAMELRLFSVKLLTWSWRLDSLTISLPGQLVQANSTENTKAQQYWSFVLVIHQWLVDPCIKGKECEKCFHVMTSPWQQVYTVESHIIINKRSRTNILGIPTASYFIWLLWKYLMIYNANSKFFLKIMTKGKLNTYKPNFFKSDQNEGSYHWEVVFGVLDTLTAITYILS